MILKQWDSTINNSKYHVRSTGSWLYAALYQWPNSRSLASRPLHSTGQRLPNLDTKGSGYSVLIGLVKAWYFSFAVRDVVTCLYCVVELVLSYTCWTRKNNKRPIHTLRGFDCLSYAFWQLYNKSCYLEAKSQVLNNLFLHILHVPTLSQRVDRLWTK